MHPLSILPSWSDSLWILWTSCFDILEEDVLVRLFWSHCSLGIYLNLCFVGILWSRDCYFGYFDSLGHTSSFLKGTFFIGYLPLLLKPLLSQGGKLGLGFQHGDLKQPSHFLHNFNVFSHWNPMGETKNRSNTPILLLLRSLGVWQTSSRQH